MILKFGNLYKILNQFIEDTGLTYKTINNPKKYNI